MYDSKTYTVLALLGTLPFVVCALLPMLGHDSIPYLGPLNRIAASYGLAIVCFLAGAHWGTYLAGRSADSLNLFVISNIIFLAVWFAFVGAGIRAAIAAQVLALVTLLFVDFRLRNGAVITASYFRVRTVATLIAVVSLLIVLIQ